MRNGALGGLVALVSDCSIVVRLGRVCEIQEIRSFVPTLRMEAPVNPCKTALIAATFLILALPDSPLAQETPVSSPGKISPQSTWAIDFHGGTYSLDKLLDAVLEASLDEGTGRRSVLPHLGEDGPDRIFRHVISLDYAHTEGKGTWKFEPEDAEEYGSVDATMVSLTYSALWHIFPPNGSIHTSAWVWARSIGKSKAREAATMDPLRPRFPSCTSPGLNAKITDRFWIHAETSLVGLVYKNWTQYYVGGVKVLF